MKKGPAGFYCLQFLGNFAPKKRLDKFFYPNEPYYFVIINTRKESLMDNTEYIGKKIHIKIDRPFGSKHPKHGFIYPINYGYVPNTISGDGEELDAYLLGVFEPVEEYDGKCIAVIHRTNDDDDKLIVVPIDKNYSDEAIEALVEFQEEHFKHVLIRK